MPDSEEVFAWLPYPRPADLKQARDWIDVALGDRRAGRRLPFAVLSAVDGSVIGSTSYWDFDAHNAHVEHAFETLGLERVAFRTDIRNERSQSAIERLGAVREGVHRHEMRREDGTWRDSVHYSILRSEWPAAKDRLRDRIAAAEAE